MDAGELEDHAQEFVHESGFGRADMSMYIYKKRVARPLPLKSRARETVLITGGAGFIGTSLAEHLLAAGQRVLIFDSLSRPDVEQNLRWFTPQYCKDLQIENADACNVLALKQAVWHSSQIYHLTAPPARTTSLKNSQPNFGADPRATLHLLEVLRSLPDPPPLIIASTNQAAGEPKDIPLRAVESRYEPINGEKANCLGENTLLDFHGPDRSSNDTVDQYVLDYARTFNLPAVLFRLSDIYGPPHSVIEDQNWVADYLIKMLDNQPIPIYGDGKQVHDILFVSDLIEAFLLAQKNITSLSGQAFNIGGGPANSISLLELIELIGQIHGQRPWLRFDHWRSGDRRYHVADIAKFQEVTGWQPRVNVQTGVQKLYHWLLQSRRIAQTSHLTLEVAGA